MFNEILVGKKSQMNYVLACLTAFHEGAKEVTIKARGRSISKAVDVVEIVRKKFMTDITIKDINIGTDEIKLNDNVRRISSISIVLAKMK
ncbi:MAG: DNA-binding protein Alba [Candidatus Methanomethyliaceae archaeon]|nr:DNA-binding protein Alba [Candidatus Methanomethyliaceae archaeon]MCX8170103.1 DNA-binding protein Alba [Candidatus Methanomethyliaceae archaeon]MDW7970660.1 DNA-binding protein Alba [Nitrososphaerota archaeon]